MLSLLADENSNGDVVTGLLLREPTFDVVRIQDVGMLGAVDPEVLTWAAEQNRIVLTHDRKTMPKHAYARVNAGQRMPGVFVVDDRLPVGTAIQEILLTSECSAQVERNNLVAYLPL